MFITEDPNVDLFAKRKKEKKERVAKNELQRLRNIARSQKSKGNPEISEMSHPSSLCKDPPSVYNMMYFVC